MKLVKPSEVKEKTNDDNIAIFEKNEKAEKL